MLTTAERMPIPCKRLRCAGDEPWGLRLLPSDRAGYMLPGQVSEIDILSGTRGAYTPVNVGTENPR